MGFVFAAELIAILIRTGGRMLYSLDDAYIHLRMSEQILSGTFGINEGIPASASSSIVWPFLLTPFARLGFHDWVPLAINLACTLLSVLLLDGILQRGWRGQRPSPWATAAVAFVLGLALNLVPLAFTGLEHSLQMALTLTVVLGLLVVVDGESAPWYLWVSVVLLPMVRFEMGILSLAAVVLVILVTRRWTPLLWLAGALAGIGAYAAFLLSLGLPAVPGSVLVKSGGGFQGGLRAGVRRTLKQAVKLWGDILQPKGRGGVLALVVVVVILLLLLLVARVSWRNRRLWLVALPVPVALLHITFVGNSESDRYNAYVLAIAVAVVTAVALPLLWDSGRAARWSGSVVAVALVGAAFFMFGIQIFWVPGYSLSIYEQQYQMHRLAADTLREPVAVNDLGLVSYRNDYDVLDLWGLGSDQARLARRAAEPGWMDRLMAEQGVDVAFIYSDWFEGQIPSSWIRVGELTTKDQGSTAGRTVDLYARTPDAADRLRAAIQQFRPTSSEQTTVTLVD